MLSKTMLNKVNRVERSHVQHIHHVERGLSMLNTPTMLSGGMLSTVIMLNIV
jgi:hypothetical protein